MSRSYVSWNKEMDRALATVLYDQVAQGNRVEGAFQAAAYQAAMEHINSSLKLNLTRDNIKNRLKVWTSHYTAVIKIQNSLSGIHWDDVRKMVVVTPDDLHVWNTYVKKNKDVSAYKNKVIENWDDIAMLCGADKATGVNAENFEDAVGAMVEEEAEINSSPSAQAPSTSNTSAQEGNGKKRRRNDPLGDVIGELAATMKKYLVAKKAQDQQQPSAEEIHCEVSTVVGLSQYEIFKATQRLMSDNPKEFELLKSLPDGFGFCLTRIIRGCGFRC